MAGINVPIGPAIVEYGEGADMHTYDITKGGIVFTSTSSTQDITVDQHGDTIVKSIFKGGSAQVVVPFALQDLERIQAAIPNSTYTTDGVKEKVVVKSQAGYNMLDNAKKLIIKPTSPDTTPNDWITIPLAGAKSDLEYTYNSDNERVANLTFMAYPDMDDEGTLFILGDETAAPSAG